MEFKKQTSQEWMQVAIQHPSAYEGRYVVHTSRSIVFASEDLSEVEAWIKGHQSEYAERLVIFLVPRHFGRVRLRMLKLKSVLAGEWLPTYEVTFFPTNGRPIIVDMLVDSGADVTFIPFSLGQRLGFSTSPDEVVLTASGVGSEINYLLRNAHIQINNSRLDIRLLWAQDEDLDDLLLGHLDVFDHFDVLFSQQRREIIFTPVEPAEA